MRTKVLLGLAALAAGVATSMAQSNVYSLNIVGYVNVALPKGFSFQSNPLDAGVTNGANEVYNNSTGQYDFCEIHQWNGTGYTISVFDSSTDDTSTGFTDRPGNPVKPPVLSSGQGYLFNVVNGSPVTNATYVGNVRVGTNSTAYANSSLTAVGSALPLSGGISTALGMNNSAGAFDFAEIEQAVRSGTQITGFKISVFDSSTDDTSTGFTDRPGNPVPEPQVALGEGFYFHNASGHAITWTQVLLNQ